MRREGTALQGVGVVTLKELSDHLSSARMRVLEWLVVLTALARRVKRIEPAGPHTRRLNNTLRALDTLPLRLVPA